MAETGLVERVRQEVARLRDEYFISKRQGDDELAIVLEQAADALSSKEAEIATVRQAAKETVTDLQEKLTKCGDALVRKEAEIAELRQLVYVPGSWKCAKCKFLLVQSNLNALDGTVTARDTPGDKCPNCDGPLWRVTWKQDRNEAYELCEQQVQRAVALEEQIAELRRALARYRYAV